MTKGGVVAHRVSGGGKSGWDDKVRVATFLTTRDNGKQTADLSTSVEMTRGRKYIPESGVEADCGPLLP